MSDHFTDKAQKSDLSFAAYIERCRDHIVANRPDLEQPHLAASDILLANSPFQHYPSSLPPPGKRIKYGVLLIHGLLACPFSLREISEHLQAQGILSRAILLPGHGTRATDLINVTYQDWLDTVQYGVASLREEVEHIFLIGYSIGAALALYHRLHDKSIAGIIMITPAIKIKVPYSMIVSWHYLLKKMTPNKLWIYRDEEVDYAKYLSLPYNAVRQVLQLTDLIAKTDRNHFNCPMLMISSHEDETISNDRAVRFFKELPHEKNKLVLYSATAKPESDARIIVRQAYYPMLHIKHLSHVAIPFSAANKHYGQQGDYTHAAHKAKDHVIYYGAYNQLEVDVCDQLFKLGLTKYKRRSLTYNPDFSFMVQQIVSFITEQDV